MKSSSIESLFVLSLGVAGCFAEAEQTSAGTNASSTGVDTDADDSSGGRPATSDSTGSAPSTDSSEPDTTDSTTATETSETTGTSGTADTGTADTGTTGEPMVLCPSFVDTFDGPIDPVWSLVWEDSIDQAGGQSVFTITAATSDQYPRRVLPWSMLGASGAVAFRVQPATLPNQFGTQLNTILEGPSGYDVTLSLNRTNALQYRLTSRANGTETLHFEGNANFPADGWVQFEVDADQAVVSILDIDGAVVTSFDAVDIPFDLAEASAGFAATNWGSLPADIELSVETFELECAK